MGSELDHGGTQLIGLLNLASSTTFLTQSRTTRPGMAPSTNALALLHPLAIKKMSHRHDHGPI